MPQHHTTRVWAIPKLRGKYFSILILSSFFEIEVLNCDKIYNLLSSITVNEPDNKKRCIIQSSRRVHQLSTVVRIDGPRGGVNWAFFLFSKPLMRNLNNLTYTILGIQIHQTLVEEKTSYSRQVTQACKRY
jgi:hypothetical protein